MNVWGIAWAAWLGAFFAIELPALQSQNRHGTLSVQLSRLFRTRHRHGRFLFAIVVTAGIGALVAHMLTDIHDDTAAPYKS